MLLAGRYVFTLESECVNGKKMRIKVVFTGVGPGIGIDTSATQSDVSFTDPFTFINSAAFEGDGFIAQAGVSWPPTLAIKQGQILAGEPNAPHGGGYSAIRLGNAGSVGPGDLYGFDLSLEALYGKSTVTSSETIDCCE